MLLILLHTYKSVKSQAEQFTTHKDTALTYEKYSELLIAAAKTHDNLKWDDNFSSKSHRNIYDIGNIPNDDDGS